MRILAGLRVGVLGIVRLYQMDVLHTESAAEE